MNITLRRNQRIDVEIPIQRFPSFQSSITLLGVGIPAGVFLSFNNPVSNPRGGESVRMTIQTNSLFNGGSFTLTGTPAPTLPLAFNLTVNNTLEQYELKYAVKSTYNNFVPNALIQVYDLITGTLINSALSINDVTSVNIPVTYRRIRTVVTPNADLGLLTKNQLTDLPDPAIQKSVNIPITLEDDSSDLVLKLSISSQSQVANSVDTIKVLHEGVTLFTNTNPSTTLNPKLESLTFLAKKPFPKEFTVTVERTGHVTYSTVVRYDNPTEIKSLTVTLTKIPSQEVDNNLRVNYIYSRYTDKAPQKIDLRLKAGPNQITLVPSNFSNFQSNNIVPIAERSISSSASGTLQRSATLELSMVDSTFSVDYGIMSLPTPNNTKALAVWNQVVEGTSNGQSTLAGSYIVGKRVVSVELDTSPLALDLALFEVFSDENKTPSLRLLQDTPSTQGVVGPKVIFGTSLNEVYVSFRSRSLVYSYFQRVDLSNFPEGSFIRILITGVPFYAGFNVVTGSFTDYSKVVIMTNLIYNFNAQPSLSVQGNIDLFRGEIQ